MPKNVPFWRVFEKPEACGQTVLPDRSVLIGQKMPISQNSNATFWVIFKQCEHAFLACFPSTLYQESHFMS